MNFPTRVGNLEVGNIDSMMERICKTGCPASCNQAAVDRVRRVAMEDSNKPKRHRSAREISRETVK